MRSESNGRGCLPKARVALVASLLLLPRLSVAQSTSSLSLNEIWSVEWSGTTRISTVVANDEGVVGIQSGPWVHLLIDSQAPTLVGNFEGLDIGGVAITGPGLELVDRRASRLCTVPR